MSGKFKKANSSRDTFQNFIPCAPRPASKTQANILAHPKSSSKATLVRKNRESESSCIVIDESPAANALRDYYGCGWNT